MFHDEDFGFEGDPRRCPVHGCATSSANGLFDCPCPDCESEAEDDHQAWLAFGKDDADFQDWLDANPVAAAERERVALQL